MEWLYLEHMMQQLGFNFQWISLIMSYVKIVSYRILLDGDLFEPIVLSMGLR